MADQKQLIPESVRNNVVPAKISMPFVRYNSDFQIIFPSLRMRDHLALSASGIFSAATAVIGTVFEGGVMTVGPLCRFKLNHLLLTQVMDSEESIADGRFVAHFIGESTLPEYHGLRT
ncbi:hypothetical protein BGZ96_006913 [Linnemannia gamsii]|uniref:Uncharacterized protein n=1 Tax=Linnemannia gamsii TaxID=64522 RepID=A0ABQ7K2D8_9FUNG|nr:hypothetical protein BGZ96_006913 [Linnemannia gamsii]